MSQIRKFRHGSAFEQKMHAATSQGTDCYDELPPIRHAIGTEGGGGGGWSVQFGKTCQHTFSKRLSARSLSFFEPGIGQYVKCDEAVDAVRQSFNWSWRGFRRGRGWGWLPQILHPLNEERVHVFHVFVELLLRRNLEREEHLRVPALQRVVRFIEQQIGSRLNVELPVRIPDAVSTT